MAVFHVSFIELPFKGAISVLGIGRLLEITLKVSR